MSERGEVLMQVNHLDIDYLTPEKTRLSAVRDISFELKSGRMLGLVGESGCGKTTLALAVMRLLPVAGRIVGGEIIFRGRDLLALTEAEMERVRWQEIAIVFQGAMNALNPVLTVGRQIAEAIRVHNPQVTPAETQAHVAELMDLVGIAPERANQYPFQFSGGMRQRVMIAMALACSPCVLIADEPTTALDVMIQAQILELLESLRDQLGLAVILVTHDLGVVAELCDDVLVMYAGVTAEYAPVDRLYNHPAHPYTQSLLAAFPNLANLADRLSSIPGYPPRLDDLPTGCRFAPRCPQAFERCWQSQPSLYRVERGHSASCFLLEGR